MADNAVPTLAPNPNAADVPQTSLPPPQENTRNIEKEVLFDSIAQEGLSIDEESGRSPFKAIFTGLLWFGYTIAVIVALVLVWSAAKGMLGAMSH